MKKTKVTQVTLPDKTSIRSARRLYTVFLTSGISKGFRNRKDALAFMAMVSRTMSGHLHELNRIYAEAWRMYRDLWFYLDQKNGHDLDRRLYNLLDELHRDFGQSVKPAPLSLGNTLPVNGFFGILDKMEKLWPLMADYYFHRRIYHSQHICSMYGRRCAEIRESVLSICR